MEITEPKKYQKYTTQELLDNRFIVESKDNRGYLNCIFPNKTNVGTTDNFTRKRIITKIEDTLFDDFHILDKRNQVIYLKDDTVRKYIKSKEYGDIENSYKRYNNVNFPIDYNTDGNDFLNIKVGEDLFINDKQKNIDDIPFNNYDKHEYKNISNHLMPIKDRTNKHKKFNDKTTIEYVLKWAKDEGINFIYCIVEYRPYIRDKKYTANFCYYTVIGSKFQYK